MVSKPPKHAEPRREGCAGVLERLFQKHGRALRTFLGGRVRNQSEVEDIVQEVFTRLAQLRDLPHKLAVDRTDNRAFIFTTANNYLVDQERRKVLERNYLGMLHHTASESVVEATPEVIATAAEELELVKKAMNQLKPEWRAAFVLSRFDHLSYREIADEMNISIKTVEKYITCVLVKLRDATANHPRAGGE